MNKTEDKNNISTAQWIVFKDPETNTEYMKCSKCGAYWSIADHAKVFDYCFKCGRYILR